MRLMPNVVFTVSEPSVVVSVYKFGVNSSHSFTLSPI